MIIRILAMIAHEFMEEYRKLNEKHIADESVTGFHTQIAETSHEEREGIGFTAKWHIRK